MMGNSPAWIKLRTHRGETLRYCAAAFNRNAVSPDCRPSSALVARHFSVANDAVICALLKRIAHAPALPAFQIGAIERLPIGNIFGIPRWKVAFVPFAMLVEKRSSTPH